jgi:hypothetical protein
MYWLAPFSDIVKLQAKKNFVSTYNKVVKQYAEEKRNLAVQPLPHRKKRFRD